MKSQIRIIIRFQGRKGTVEITWRETCNMSLDDFELYKKNEKEGNIESHCVVAHTVESKAEEIDSKLREWHSIISMP